MAPRFKLRALIPEYDATTGRATVQLLSDYRDAFKHLHQRVAGAVWELTASKWRRPRTVGPHSQNNRFYGHCEDLAEQVLDENRETKYTKQQIHDSMLRMSVVEGYPTYLDLNGVETPLPSAQATVEDMNVVTRTLHRFADIHGFWLHEYVAEGPHKGKVYKSVGGRSYEEMKRLLVSR